MDPVFIVILMTTTILFIKIFNIYAMREVSIWIYDEQMEHFLQRTEFLFGSGLILIHAIIVCYCIWYYWLTKKGTLFSIDEFYYSSGMMFFSVVAIGRRFIMQGNSCYPTAQWAVLSYGSMYQALPDSLFLVETAVMLQCLDFHSNY